MIKAFIALVKSVAKKAVAVATAMSIATYCFFNGHNGYFKDDTETSIRIRVDDKHSQTMGDDINTLQQQSKEDLPSGTDYPSGIAVEYGNLSNSEKQYLKDMYDMIDKCYEKTGISKEEIPPEVLYCIPMLEGNPVILGDKGYIAPRLTPVTPEVYDKGYSLWTVNGSNYYKIGATVMDDTYKSPYQMSQEMPVYSFDNYETNSNPIGTFSSVGQTGLAYIPNMCISALISLQKRLPTIKNIPGYDNFTPAEKAFILTNAHNRGEGGAKNSINGLEGYNVLHADLETFQKEHMDTFEALQKQILEDGLGHESKSYAYVDSFWMEQGAKSSDNTNKTLEPYVLISRYNLWKDSYQHGPVNLVHFNGHDISGILHRFGAATKPNAYIYDGVTLTYSTIAYLFSTYSYRTAEYILSKEYPGQYHSDYAGQLTGGNGEGQGVSTGNSWLGSFTPYIYYGQVDKVKSGNTSGLSQEVINNANDPTLSSYFTKYTVYRADRGLAGYQGKYYESGWRGNYPIVGQTIANQVGSCPYWGSKVAMAGCSVLSAYVALIGSGLKDTVPQALQGCMTNGVLDPIKFVAKAQTESKPLVPNILTKWGYQVTSFAGNTTQGQKEIIDTVKRGYPVVINFQKPQGGWVECMDSSGNKGKTTLQSGSDGHFMVVINTYEKDGKTWVDLYDSRVGNAGKGVSNTPSSTDNNAVSLNWDDIVNKHGIRGVAYTIMGIRGGQSATPNQSRGESTGNISDPITFYERMSQSGKLILPQQATVSVINRNKIQVYIGTNTYLEITGCQTNLTGNSLKNANTEVSSKAPSKDKVTYVKKDNGRIVASQKLSEIGTQ